MSLGGILLCITGKHELLVVNLDSSAITSKIICFFPSYPFSLFQVQKPCLLILDIFHNCRSRYII